MAAPRYLTKSRWKLARECPTKLYYTRKGEYFDTKTADEFLAALAEGGFQVGELAKLYYPGGVNIDELEYETALMRTAELLGRECVTIYEAAFLFENLFIRADILIKEGKRIRLIEVKAKLFDPAEACFTTMRGVAASWRPYLEDIAFQKYVVTRALPGYAVSASLLLADKSKRASVDGLNQRFLLYEEDGRKRVRIVGPVDVGDLGDRILTEIYVDAEIDLIWEDEYAIAGEPVSFGALVRHFSDHYAADRKIADPLGARCASCEFRATDEQMAMGLRSGFHECWTEGAAFRKEDFGKLSILDIWDFRRKEKYIREGKYFGADALEGLQSENPLREGEPGLSRVGRQVLQIKKSIARDDTPYIDKEGLAAYMREVRYPLHFIDFETTAVAIPFHAGRRPYEQIAFQFSHHVMEEDGTIGHRGEWIHRQTGAFPNFEFVRALKKELENDEGTIFKYAAHENTILNAIYYELEESTEPDRELLCEWIRTVTHGNGWEGSRDMVDMKELVLRYYYCRLMNGSNSIKAVMPAVLATSDHLQEKYSRPIYGTGIKSLNFIDQVWVVREGGRLLSPYELLPALQGAADGSTGIAEGGAAMTAFAKMQFMQLTEGERENIRCALLKYCELDTFSMVLIWEAWKDWIG